MPDLFQYTEYRRFLADAWAERKARDPRFSHRFIALRAGFSSSAFFSRILSGDVNLTPSGALRLAEVFHLGQTETHYFELLVLMDQARSHEERMHFLDRIASWRRTPIAVAESAQIAFCEDWRAVAVLQCLDLVEHRDDPERLGSFLAPPVGGEDVSRILSLLRELGLAQPDGDGVWRKTEALLAADSTESAAISKFRKATLALAIEAMDRFGRDDRSISTLTVSLSKASFERVRDRIRHLRRDILELARDDGEPDRVVQINFQVFPLAMVPRKETT